MKKLVHAQIQAQMEHAVECLNADQPALARLAYLECAELCQQLELLVLSAPKPKEIQPPLDIP